MKKIGLVLAASILAISLTACNENKTDVTESVTDSSSEKIEDTTEDIEEDETDETSEDIDDEEDNVDNTDETEEEPEETEPLIPIPTADPSKEGQYAKPIQYHVNTVNYFYDSLCSYESDFFDNTKNLYIGFIYHYFMVDENTSFTSLRDTINKESTDDLNIGLGNFYKCYDDAVNGVYDDYLFTTNNQWFEIYRSDSLVFSYYIQSSIHPDDQFRTYNYDSTGKVINLKDTCTDYTKLYEAMITEVEDNFDTNNFVDGYKEVLKKMFNNNDIEFVITYDGIKIMIPGQDITKTCYINICINISYQKYKDVLVPDYWTDLPCDVVVIFDDYPFDTDFIYYLDYDTNQDGTYEHYEISDSKITINNKVNELNSSDEHRYCYLIIKDGHCFIYIVQDLAEAIDRTDIYEINGNKATFFGSYDAALTASTNPTYLSFQIRREFIGKSEYRFEGTLNDDFQIERTSDYISYEQIDSIRTLVDIEGTDVNTNETFIIPADSLIILTQTDFETYVEFKLQVDTSKTIRVKYDGAKEKLDGKTFEECFTENTLKYWGGF